MKNLFHFSVAPDALMPQLIEICRSDPTEAIVYAAMDIFERLPNLE